MFLSTRFTTCSPKGYVLQIFLLSKKKLIRKSKLITTKNLYSLSFKKFACRMWTVCMYLTTYTFTMLHYRTFSTYEINQSDVTNMYEYGYHHYAKLVSRTDAAEKLDQLKSNLIYLWYFFHIIICSTSHKEILHFTFYSVHSERPIYHQLQTERTLMYINSHPYISYSWCYVSKGSLRKWNKNIVDDMKI